MSRLQFPIHVERVGSQDIRFFRSPEFMRTGRPDMPWHVCDDLWAALGIDPDCRVDILRRLRLDWRDPETIGSPDGPVVIVPYLMGDILLDEWLRMRGISDADEHPQPELRLRGSFRRGNTSALKAMTSHLGGMAKLLFALEAMDAMDNLIDK